jgi:Ca-activated chloride channel family protein
MSAIRKVRLHLLSALGIAMMLSGLFVAATPPAPLPREVGKKTLSADEKATALEANVTQGALRVVKENGGVVECPLRHTDVKAEVAGFIARVKVTQTFYNPTSERIEAVYVFPLPHEAAVDDMTMVVGGRKIVGVIKRRAEARQIYQEALAAGQTAALLEQERPNIFTQSVGNIDPGQEVNIEIRYVDVLNYDMGTYEFHFPMVVGPRFIPGGPVSSTPATPPELQGKVSPPVPNTDRVPDASRITPPVLKPGYRNGHDVALSLQLDAGVPIQDLKVANHQAEIKREGDRQAEVTLSPADSILNKDFVLSYHVVGKKPEMAVLAHTGDYTAAKRLGQGYFMLMIQPKEDERLTKSPPREIVFLLDVSGSMSGQPTEKVKEAMREMLKLCREIDTVQVITFASQTRQLFDKPVPINSQNVARALNFTEGLQGGGGTYMFDGVKRAIDQPKDAQRVRIVIMLTDGYIGNEAEIIEHVGKNCGDQIRFWAIGIGSSPNMFLIGGVARQGGGMGKKLELKENAAGLAEEVITRIQRAQLAKIAIDWGGLDVAETYPAKIPELWAGRPVILFGRYAGGGAGEVAISGSVEGQPVRWPLQVTLPKSQASHDGLAKVWARKKIEDLMQQTYYQGSPAVEEEVTAIALDYRLMSQYTSFVAVDAKEAGKIKDRPAQPPRRMLVPVPLPEGTSWEGFFGPTGETPSAEVRQFGGSPAPQAPAKAAGRYRALDALSRQSAYGSGMGGMAGPGMMSGDASGPASKAMPRVMPSASAPASTPAMGKPQSAAEPLSYRLAGRAGESKQKFEGRLGEASRRPTAGVFLRRARGPREESPMDRSDKDGYFFDGRGMLPQVLPDATQPIVNAARQLLDAGRKRLEKKGYDDAQTDLDRACFLARAAANRGDSSAVPIADQAMAELESLHAVRVEAWKKQVPGLSTKLDLVLRDVSVDEALQATAKAAGLEIRLVKGSIGDVEWLLASGNARVNYLDLRGATVAQALDWALQPLRLTWEPEESGKAILAGSQRRLSRVSGWVYDVAAIALPSSKELGKSDKTAERYRETAEEFLAAIRKSLGLSEKEITWFALGQLLVIGDLRTHGQVADLLSQLADPEAKPAPTLASLHEKTSRRAGERRENVAGLREQDRLTAVAATHDEQSWRLLSAAMAGQLDLEALTELQIAWKADETARLLDGTGLLSAWRSAWAIATASRLVADQPELASLADAVRGRCQPAVPKAVASLKQNPQDLETALAAVYATMTLNDPELRALALAALSDKGGVDRPLAGLELAARVLLGEAREVPGEPFGKLVDEDAIQGEDVVVLMALACRRADTASWAAFRAAMSEILSNQPLPGEVVVLVHRLSGHQIAAK